MTPTQTAFTVYLAGVAIYAVRVWLLIERIDVAAHVPDFDRVRGGVVAWFVPHRAVSLVASP